MAFVERLSRGPHGRYSSLSTDESGSETTTGPTPAPWQGKEKPMTWKKVASHVLIALLGLILGLMWRDWPILSGHEYIQPSGNTPQVWHENHTFVGSPTADTQRAWEELIPKGKGFVSHPQLASPPKSVSVYHQIHCLHGIRTAYYIRMNELYKAQHKHDLVNQFIEELEKKGDNRYIWHLDHCFEYLRQALICAADSNLEDLEVDAMGEATAPGWGTQRVCRNFEQLGEWSRKWRASEDDDIL